MVRRTIDAIRGSLRRELCPYCFEYFRLRDTPFRCSSLPARCAPQADEVRGELWGDTVPIGRVIPPAGYFVRESRCPECKGASRKRLCPECHSELPVSIGETRNYVIAVIGAKEAGKSHYLAVLIDRIKKIGPRLNLLLEPTNDATIHRYNRDFKDPVFNERRVIDATASAQAGGAVRHPLVFRLAITGKNVLGRSSIRKAVILVFFDTAGEDLNSQDVMSAVNKYIYRSNGIILLIDPLQLPQVRHRVRGTDLPNENAETSDILSRTTGLIQNGTTLRATDRIPIPIAVAFSKFDAVRELVDDQYQLNGTARHEGGFDLSDSIAVNDEMAQLLKEWGESDVVNQVKVRYKKYGFFGLSALGCNPHGPGGKIAQVSPRRVEDPFLWLLYANNLLRPLGSGSGGGIREWFR